METLHVTVLLDRSGSMADIKTETISGFNEYVKTLKESTRKEGIDAYLTFIQFDSYGTDTLYDDRPVKDITTLTDKEFVPRGWTPLHEAVSKTLDKLEAKNYSGRVVFATITDGQENASGKDYSKEKNNTRIKALEKKGWLVTYLGANQDAWAEGQSMGFSGGKSMTYSVENIGDTFKMMARSTMSYGMAETSARGLVDADYTMSERQQAIN